MKIPGRQTIDRCINYHSISLYRLKRYLDHLRIGVASFPANEHNQKAMNEFIVFLESQAPGSLEMGKIMDIGCGDGYMLSRIKKLYNNEALSGISVCRSDISLAKKINNVKVKFGDMHSIPQKNRSIDTVLARHCLEHSPMPLLALFEMRRIMKHGNNGILGVVLPAYNPYWVKYEGHFHCMPKDNWHKLFDVAGFDVISEETGYWFAVATNRAEKEWRFMLKPKTNIIYNQPYRSFYTVIFHQLLSIFKRF